MRLYKLPFAAFVIGGFALLSCGCDAAKEAASDIADRAKDAVGDGENTAAPADTTSAEPTAAAPAAPTPQQLVDAFLNTSPRQYTDDMIVEAANASPANEAVTSLKLSAAPVTVKAIEALQRFPNLKELDLSGGRLLSAASCQPIANLQQLESLKLAGTAWNDAMMPVLSGLSGLRELDLDHTKVSDQGLVHLQNLENLRSLKLRRATTNGAVFKLLKLPNLERLEVGQTLFGVEGSKYLKNMPNLKVLIAGTAGISDETLKGLRACKNLEELFVGSNGITDDGLKFLKSSKKLKKLSLSKNTRVSGRGLIVMKSLRQVEMLDIDGTSANQQTVNDLVELLPDTDIMWGGRTW
ncbi:MAG: leucine-rich repeat domain-containing protein [Planctomycetaceae bacterium]